eukprot:TRINITY_DN8046_c0_g2_i1.p1 TRINITY_DN8046_c0_g2~~TRINITY_DN8046_c0_g2_i1.p1  ORF type:complete len:396 (-),score=92.30 TRINITY_DN8046_c0_g2_i1:122-1309(-)
MNDLVDSHPEMEYLGEPDSKKARGTTNELLSEENVDEMIESQPSPANEPMVFSVGEKVLAYHNQFLYDAIILNYNRPNNTYFIKYTHWGEKFASWLYPDEIVVNTPENRKQMDTKKSEAIERAKRHENRTRMNFAADTISLPHKHRLYEFPENLKIILADEHRIVKNKHLTHRNVEMKAIDLLNEFKSTFQDDVGIQQYCTGIRKLFNKMCLATLFYRHEIEMRNEIIASDLSPVESCRPSLLLRFLVRFPESFSTVLSTPTLNSLMVETSKKLLSWCDTEEIIKKYFNPQFGEAIESQNEPKQEFKSEEQENEHEIKSGENKNETNSGEQENETKSDDTTDHNPDTQRETEETKSLETTNNEFDPNNKQELQDVEQIMQDKAKLDTEENMEIDE